MLSAQPNKIYDIGLAVYRHFNAEMLHAVPLNAQYVISAIRSLSIKTMKTTDVV